jgi:uncharacterized protein (TIGR02996 family)
MRGTFAMTPEEEAFLADIADHPEDDSLRLIYADWLEDSGQVERAAFIRVQCELARLPRDDPRRRELKTRERELQEKHERQWLGPLLDFVEDWGFQRGLLEAVTFCRSDLRAVLGSPHLGCLHDLELARVGPRADAVCEVLEESPLPGRLERLAVRDSLLRLRGVEALRRASFVSLKELDLDGNSLCPDSVWALRQSRFWPNLVALSLNRNPLRDQGASELLAAPRPPRMDLLRLVGCDIGEQLQQALRESSKKPEKPDRDQVEFDPDTYHPVQPKVVGKKVSVVRPETKWVVEVIGMGGRVDLVLGEFLTYKSACYCSQQWSDAHPKDLRLTRECEVKVPGKK